MTSKTVSVLLIDDDAMDVKAVRRAFKRHKIQNPVTVAKDGQEALEHLRGERGKAQMRRPMLILLDLQMPRMNGFEFLQALRTDPALKDLAVYVLTTSSHDVDRSEAQALNVRGYILKGDPDAFDRFESLINSVANPP